MNNETIQTKGEKRPFTHEEMLQRLDFQRYLINKNNIKHENAAQWIGENAKIIGDIIDGEDNCTNCSLIKSMVENKNFKPAAELYEKEIEARKNMAAKEKETIH